MRKLAPTPAMAVAVAALFIALGGTGYAASTLIRTHRASVATVKDNKTDRAIATSVVRKLAPVLSVAFASGAGSAGNATHASRADTATDATHAATADSATNAGHAGAADTATSATSAGHAATADSATSAAHAGSADTAANITGETGPLASDQTERGDWAVFGTAPASLGGAVSFPIPLGVALPATAVHYVPRGASAPAECAGGTFSDPKAASGNLCVYEAEVVVSSVSFGNIFSAASRVPGADTWGFYIRLNSSGSGDAYAAGSWAVTG